MLITPNIRANRVLCSTWPPFLFSVTICTLSYFLTEHLLHRYFTVPVFMPTVLGTALAFFVGFNNNQAYDRWWEARKIWGALVNDSRTWTRQLLTFPTPSAALPSAELNTLRDRMVHRHIAFLYALKGYLRKAKEDTYSDRLPTGDAARIAGQGNVHNALLTLQSADLATLNNAGAIDGFRFLEMDRTLTAFCDDMGRSERIRNTVFPTTYNYYARLFIWFFIFAVTSAMNDSLGAWSILLGTFLGYVFLMIQNIGQVLLNPFDPIPTGIPLDQITRTIEINLLEMLGEQDVPPPVESVDGEYVL